jgi:hypothetical protein
VLLARLNVSVATRARWGISPRPAYLVGVLAAAEQALRQQVSEISVIEFGVAGGRGLLTLQQEAEAVQRALGIAIKVYGFDMGPEGLPPFIGDYRDHPDVWRPGQFASNVSAVRNLLTDRTTLIVGNVRHTVAEFFSRHHAPPVGFASFDLDLYSSTRDALRIFMLPDTRMLWHVPLYFDDTHGLFTHRFAGELLAIEEFNEQSETVKIDRWHGVKAGRPFAEALFLDALYAAHDLAAISKAQAVRRRSTPV